MREDFEMHVAHTHTLEHDTHPGLQVNVGGLAIHCYRQIVLVLKVYTLLTKHVTV